MERTTRQHSEQEQRATLFREITNKMYELYTRKNNDYGDSVSKTYEIYGLDAFLVRITDKVGRLNALSRQKKRLVKDEKIEDTLIDLANYAVLALVELKLEDSRNFEHLMKTFVPDFGDIMRKLSES